MSKSPSPFKRLHVTLNEAALIDALDMPMVEAVVRCICTDASHGSRPNPNTGEYIEVRCLGKIDYLNFAIDCPNACRHGHDKSEVPF